MLCGRGLELNMRCRTAELPPLDDALDIRLGSCLMRCHRNPTKAMIKAMRANRRRPAMDTALPMTPDVYESEAYERHPMWN